jgi:cytochrome c biogenesis protein CcmG/thiol:disulfide interchange protein DsbE
LNFWASWCAPCEDEAPLLQEAYQRYGDDVEFVGIDIRDARDDAIEFVDEYGLTYPQVRDEVLRVYNQYGLLGQPESFFVDQNGIVVQHVKGPLRPLSVPRRAREPKCLTRRYKPPSSQGSSRS